MLWLIFSAPASWSMPPPRADEFPDSVTFVSVDWMMPWKMPPPIGLELPLKVLSFTVRMPLEPSCQTPPPRELAVFPLTVYCLMVTVPLAPVRVSV